jgi:peroxiredoxin
MRRIIVSLAVALALLAPFDPPAARSAPPPNGSAEQPSLGIAAGTPAPDGIGVTVDRSPGAGQIANGPWEDESVIRPLQAGAKMPANSVVQTVTGKRFNLNAAVASKPTVLIFYRGGWCPYCNAHLRQLQGSADALQNMGYQLLAISTDTPAAIRATLTRDKLSYQLLSDSRVGVAAKFGLRYKVVASYLAHVKNDHGTDLVAQNGGYLLTPGAFILDRAGVIRFAYVNNNFSVRISQQALLQAAREALGK